MAVLLLRHSHPATVMATTPMALRTIFSRTERALECMIWVYVSATGDTIGRGRCRLSGAGTQREMKAKDSDAHTGQVCPS